MPKVLAILTDGFEEIEAVAPIDLLRRAEVEVTLAALTPTEIGKSEAESLAVTGRCGMVLQAECTLAAALAEGEVETHYDCVFLPGGPGVKTLRSNALVLDAVRRQHAAGRLVAAICAAPLVLLDAGILRGRRYTAHGSVADELPEILVNEAVVIDESRADSTNGRGGPVVTSRGAGTALEFGLVLVAQLAGRARAAQVSREIHMTYDAVTK